MLGPAGICSWKRSGIRSLAVQQVDRALGVAGHPAGLRSPLDGLRARQRPADAQRAVLRRAAVGERDLRLEPPRPRRHVDRYLVAPVPARDAGAGFDRRGQRAVLGKRRTGQGEGEHGKHAPKATRKADPHQGLGGGERWAATRRPLCKRFFASRQTMPKQSGQQKTDASEQNSLPPHNRSHVRDKFIRL